MFGSQSPIGGQFFVTLDDANGAQIDTANGSTKAPGQDTIYQTLLYSHTKLDATQPHNLRIDNGGDGEFALDFLVVESDVGTDGTAKVQEITLDDTSLAFSFPTGQWNATVAPAQKNIVNQYWENSTEHSVEDIGAQVELKFRGSGVVCSISSCIVVRHFSDALMMQQIHGTWFLSNITASLDGGPPTSIVKNVNRTVALYQRPQELLFMADGLIEGDHTVLLTNKGYNSSTSEWPFLNIDYAIVSYVALLLRSLYIFLTSSKNSRCKQYERSDYCQRSRSEQHYKHDHAEQRLLRVRLRLCSFFLTL